MSQVGQHNSNDVVALSLEIFPLACTSLTFLLLQAAGLDVLSSCSTLCDTLRELTVGENGLDCSAALSLERLLRACTALTSLDIEHANMKKGFEGVFKTLADSTTLRVLGLRDANMEREGGLLLAELLKASSTLTELSVPKNRLHPAVAQAWASALLENPR